MSELVEIEHNLTDKQAAFCREYLIDKNGKRAAIRAGYSENCAAEIAYEMLQKPHIQNYLYKLLDQQAARTMITADYVLHAIHEALEQCKGVEIEVPTFDAEGNEITRKEVVGRDHKNLLKAAELLGKHLKLFTDVSEQRHTFTQMGRVMAHDPNAPQSPPQALTFNVGSEARLPNGQRPNDITQDPEQGGDDE